MNEISTTSDMSYQHSFICTVRATWLWPAVHSVKTLTRVNEPFRSKEPVLKPKFVSVSGRETTFRVYDAGEPGSGKIMRLCYIVE